MASLYTLQMMFAQLCSAGLDANINHEKYTFVCDSCLTYDFQQNKLLKYIVGGLEYPISAKAYFTFAETTLLDSYSALSKV